MLDIRQTPEYANYLKSIGWTVEEIDGVYCYIKKIPVLGYFVKIQRPKKFNQKTLNKLENKYKPFQVIIESDLSSTTDYTILPNHNKIILNNHFQQWKSSYLPTNTLKLDLTINKEELLMGTKKDARRAIIRNRELGITNHNNGLNNFRNNWKKAVGWKRYVPKIQEIKALRNAFDKDSLFISDKKGLCGAIFIKTKEVAYYWQAFTKNEGRKLNVQYRIVWEGILWAKNAGCKIFDFEGIYDKRFPNKSWLGFTHFKKSFGGVEVEYPGAFIRNNFTNLLKF